MIYSKPDIVLTEEWVDISTLDSYEDVATTPITLIPKYVSNRSYLFIGGVTPPTGDDGLLLINGVGITNSSEHWWVKGNGRLSILVES